MLRRCSQSPSIAPCHFKEPTPLHQFVVFVFLQRWEWSAQNLGGGKSVFIWEAGWEKPFGNNFTFSCFRNLKILHVIRLLLPISMETTHDPKGPVLLIALKIMWHAKLCLLVIIILIRVCWHPERMFRALSTCGQRGQVWLVESLNNTACFWLYRVPVLYFIMI
jgi:hypothetical protein